MMGANPMGMMSGVGGMSQFAMPMVMPGGVGVSLGCQEVLTFQPAPQIEFCNFRGMDFSNRDFSQSEIINTNFEGAILDSAIFAGSYFEAVDFSMAVLTRASFVGASFEMNNMR